MLESGDDVGLPRSRPGGDRRYLYRFAWTPRYRRPPMRHRLTVEAYHRMGQAGVFAPEARVELIDGEVIVMAPIGSRHASTVRRLTRALVAAVGDRAHVWDRTRFAWASSQSPNPTSHC